MRKPNGLRRPHRRCIRKKTQAFDPLVSRCCGMRVLVQIEPLRAASDEHEVSRQRTRARGTLVERGELHPAVVDAMIDGGSGAMAVRQVCDRAPASGTCTVPPLRVWHVAIRVRPRRPAVVSPASPRWQGTHGCHRQGVHHPTLPHHAHARKTQAISSQWGTRSSPSATSTLMK